jgi:hypothetical protein
MYSGTYYKRWKYIIIKEHSDISEYVNFKKIIEYTHISLELTKLPNNITHLDLYYLEPKYVYDNLPQSITSLILNIKFNNFIGKMLDNLTQLSRLIFNYKYDKPIDTVNFPLTLTYISFGCNFNQSVNNLPCDLKYLLFGRKFNELVDNLPCNLMYLRFSYYFNCTVDNLSCNLIYLEFGNDFNKSVDNLPSNLKYLNFGNNFNESVDNLPCSLTHLEFNKDFDKSIDNLPDSIKFIYFNYYGIFNEKINKFPKNIKKVVYPKYYNHKKYYEN